KEDAAVRRRPGVTLPHTHPAGDAGRSAARHRGSTWRTAAPPAGHRTRDVRNPVRSAEPHTRKAASRIAASRSWHERSPPSGRRSDLQRIEHSFELSETVHLAAGENATSSGEKFPARVPDTRPPPPHPHPIPSPGWQPGDRSSG